jgi:Mrp family chromosome partitioning ATPase/predicted Fe-Mo cluster-binding NifX family protein
VNPRIDQAEKARMMQERRERLTERMAQVKHKLVVLSGKGGVGKSTVAAFLATSLAGRGKSVGLLDTDIHGPSIPKMLGIENKRVGVRNQTVIPVSVSENLKVMSIAFLLQSRRDAVIWRGPLKMGIIEEFLANVDWGPLDYLIIDSPPGTGDEPLSVCQLVPGLDGAVVVATPQEIALADVAKSIAFCGQVKIPVAGVIENMSGFVCPHCGETVDLFKSGGAERLAREMGVPFLGRLPIVPEVVDACDRGECSAAGAQSEGLKQKIEEITSRILKAGMMGETVGSSEEHGPAVAPAEPTGVGKGNPSAAATGGASQGPPIGEDGVRRIALPVDGDRLSSHFGHSSRFAIFDVKGGEIISETSEVPPPHAPGVIPSWLGDLGVKVVLAGGLGGRAIAMFEQCGITVVCGAPVDAPRNVVEAYLNGTLVVGENVCDH